MAKPQSYTQATLSDYCESRAKSLEGICFTKEPVFMLPLERLRSMLTQPPWSGYFKEEVFRLVGERKIGVLVRSPVHDFLTIAALDNEGMAYPDMTTTSCLKQPIPLASLPISAEAVADAEGKDAIKYGDAYPFRDGDYEDAVTGQLLAQPVVTNSGYVLEKFVYDNLVEQRKPCPYTRKPLSMCSPIITSGDGIEHTLYNGTVKLGDEWIKTLGKLQLAAGQAEFQRLQSIRMYQDFKALLSRSLSKELDDKEFVQILKEKLDAHVSSASPCRQMALGSELWGPGVKVQVSQFRETAVWPKDGASDFFVVLPQKGVQAPYCIPVAGLDERGLPYPANYYRAGQSIPDFSGHSTGTGTGGGIP